ncbi:hypothetical protein BDW02DRAFT_628918 [Decorospora gaudefroyi]|uniref:Uncharacterized protein n=1 Tax=Decorospora gaudefroyi TaxID=184978 RepID=A0A6A5KK97_9PLEO|nr:hypothetical protein BDW02DRAFT_628918 [Decorospora gaudefroyi]
MASHGTKVTNDPAANNKINEAVGTVTSDSLAGESLKNSGSFGEGNPKAAASKQPSSSTTTNTTDSSNATKLDAAVNSEAREAQQGWNEEKTISSSKGLGKESGVGPTYVGTGSAVNSSGETRGTSTGTSGGADIQGNIAPTAGVAGQNIDPSVLQPKGANLTEDPNLSGNSKFAEIGTENDPAREAELKFAKQDAASAAVTDRGSGLAQGGLAQGADSKFSGLRDADA